MNTNEIQNNENQTEDNIQLTDLEPEGEVKGGPLAPGTYHVREVVIGGF